MLPFTADVLFASVEQYNRALWPLPVVAPILALAGILAAFRPLRFGDRAVAALLAAGWLWTGYGYHYLHFAAIDFAAPAYAAFFLLQGLLLVWTGVVRGRLVFRFHPGLFGWTGAGLALAATLALPFADSVMGHGWPSVRLVGLASGPTAAFTLGMLLLVEGRAPVHLALIPLLWSLVAGATAWILAIPQDLVLPLVGLGSFVLIVWKDRRDRRG